MTVYIATKNESLQNELQQLLVEAGNYEIHSLEITTAPEVQFTAPVILDFSYFARIPLTVIFHFIEALRARDAKLVILIKAEDKALLKSSALSLVYPNSVILELPVTLKGLTPALLRE